jgi:hypothetical protein
MFRRRLLKIGSIPGLLAILMTWNAPTVSHALASHDRLGQALSTYCSADPAFTDAATVTPPRTPVRCIGRLGAYYGLLAHLPVLTGSTVAFAAAVPVTRAPLVVRAAVRVLPLLIAY